MWDWDFEIQNTVSRCGTTVLKTEWDFPDVGRSDLISQAAQFYNQDIKKIEEQIAQSRKKKKDGDVEPEPAPDEGGDGGSDVTPVKPE